MGRGLGEGLALGVGVAVGVAVAVGVGGGAVGVRVGVGVTPDAQYLPPVFKATTVLYPPQIIISLSVQIAACSARPAGEFVLLVPVQPFVAGLYWPPVPK